MLENNPEIPENTRHTRKYPEIPESKKDTWKYLIVYFVTHTRPEPNPLPGIFRIPDPTRPNIEKPYLLGTVRWGERECWSGISAQQIQRKKNSQSCEFS